MTTTTATITDFLLARIAEDEAAARAAEASAVSPWTDERDEDVIDAGGSSLMDYADLRRGTPAHIARHDPARVLAECAALRAVVELHRPWATGYPEITACFSCGPMFDEKFRAEAYGEGWPCLTLRALAAVYADHPDYREEWRP